MDSNSKEFKIILSALLNQSKSKKQINTDIKELEKLINSLRLVATFNKSGSKKELNAYIKQLEGQLSTLKLKAKIDNKNLKREINQALNNISYKDIDLLNIDESKIKLKVRKAIADTKAYVEKNPISLNIELKKEKLNNQLTTYLNKNSKIRESEVLLREADKIRDKISAINDKDSLRNATDSFQLFKSEVQSTGYQAKSTTDKIKNMVSGITKIGSMFGVATIAVSNFRKSLQTLKSNDTILTEISKTSEMTKQQLVDLGNEAFKTASEFGQLSSNYLVAVQEMARSGYEDTSKELGKLSLLAQSAGDMTAENANNFLLATDAAYEYSGSIEKLNAALDGANYISNKNSASLTDIADGIRVSASYAANAGVSIDELTAAEATMIATTKRSGSEMGRAFRSIILNLQQVSGEFDGEVIDEEQLKKVEDRCHSLGVELEYLKDGIATLRNPMEILKDLAEVYNSLPDNSAEKQGLISDLGGKYHANALSSLLSRWDLYEKMLAEYSQGTGSALEEANKTADSWEGRLNSLQNSWDSFVNSVTDKSAIKGGITFFDNSIQAAETLVNKLGEIPVLMTAINTAMVTMNKDYGLTQVVNPETNKIDIQGNVFGIDFSAIKAQKKHFEDAKGAIADWNMELLNGITSIEAFNSETVKNNAQLKAYLSTCSKDAPASLSGYKAYLNSVGVSTDALRLKTILLNSAISFGVGAIIQGAVWIVSKGIGAIDEYIHRVEKCKERVDEMISTFNSAIDTANSHKKTIEEIGSRYEELSKGVNDLGETFGLTTEEASEYHDICNKIAEMFPTMVQGYTDEGDAILNLKGNVDALTEAYEAEAQAAYNALIASGKDSDGNDIITDWKYSLEEDKGKGTNITRAIEELQAFMTSDMDAEMYTKLRDSASAGIYDGMTDAEKLIAGSEFLPFKIKFDLDEDGTITDEELAKAKESAKVLLQTYNAEIENNFSAMKRLTNAYLNTNEDFKKLDAQSKSAASLLLNSIPPTSDIAQVLMTGTQEEIGGYVNFLVQAFSSENSEVKDALINLFTLNKEDMSPDEMASFVNSYISVIADYLHRDENELKIQLGFEDVDELEAQYQRAIDYAKEKFNGYNPTSFFDTNSINTQDEVDNWLEVAKSANSAAEAEKKYLELRDKQSVVILSYDELSESAESATKSVDTLRSAITSVNDAFSEQAENGSISVDTMLSLVDAGYATALQFDEVTGACTINKEAMLDLVKVKIQNQIEDLKTLQTDIASKLKNDGLIASESAKGFITLAKSKAAAATAEQLASVSDYNDSIAQIKALENAMNNLDKISSGSYSTKKTSKSSSSSSTKDTWKEAFQAEYNLLKHNLEMEYITEEQYYNALSALNQKYFANNAKYLDEYRQYEEEVYKGLKSMYKDMVESKLKLLESQLDASRINYNQYTSAVGNLLTTMFKEGKLSAEDYFNYVQDKLNKQIDIYKSALSAITKCIEDEISKWEDMIDQLEKQNDVLQSQLDNYDGILSVINDVYQAEIDRIKTEQDAIQDTIDKLQTENDERKLALELEKAKWDLYRAETQRTKKLLVNGEVIYDTDKNAIRDAKENLADLTLEQTIDGLEKEKDALDETISELEKYRDLWAEITEVYKQKTNEQIIIALWGKNYQEIILRNQLSDIEEFKDKYISIEKQINDNEELIDSYNEKVEYYTQLKNQWSSITSVYEDEMNKLYASQLLGAQWESDVLSGRLDVLNNFKDQYVSLQQELADATIAANNAIVASNLAAQNSQASSNVSVGNSSGGSGSSGGSSSPAPNTTETKYVVQDINTGTVYLRDATLTQCNNYISSHNLEKVTTAGNIIKVRSKNAPSSTSKSSGTIGGGGVMTMEQYASGTDNAEEGWHKISEKPYGNEIVIDNNDNAYVAEGEQLHYFEGGEKVIKASESSKILANQGNLIPLDSFEFTGIDGEKFSLSSQELQEKLLSNFRNNYSFVQPNIQTPKYDYVKVQNNNTTPVVQNVTLNLPNVTNNSGYDRVIKELKQAQLDALQVSSHRR